MAVHLLGSVDADAEKHFGHPKRAIPVHSAGDETGLRGTETSTGAPSRGCAVALSYQKGSKCNQYILEVAC